MTNSRPLFIMFDIILNSLPYHELSYLDSMSGGGRELKPLRFFRGTVRGLPDQWPPLIAMADLQGRAEIGAAPETLIGCRVAQQLAEIHATARLPEPGSCAGVLAGDFYTVPEANRRGGTGDVTAVWHHLRASVGALVGVAGNHDLFAEGPPAGHLDGTCVEIGSLRLGGIAGIIGDPRKPNRRSAERFIELLTTVIAQRPHVLVLHSAPHVDDANPGDERIRRTLEMHGYAGLVICGHVHWRDRVRSVGAATVLNVHEAVVTLVPEK